MVLRSAHGLSCSLQRLSSHNGLVNPCSLGGSRLSMVRRTASTSRPSSREHRGQIHDPRVGADEAPFPLPLVEHVPP